MFLSLRERGGEFDAYDGFMDRKLNVKVGFENCDVKPFMPMFDL